MTIDRNTFIWRAFAMTLATMSVVGWLKGGTVGTVLVAVAGGLGVVALVISIANEMDLVRSRGYQVDDWLDPGSTRRRKR